MFNLFPFHFILDSEVLERLEEEKQQQHGNESKKAKETTFPK